MGEFVPTKKGLDKPTYLQVNSKLERVDVSCRETTHFFTGLLDAAGNECSGEELVGEIRTRRTRGKWLPLCARHYTASRLADEFNRRYRETGVELRPIDNPTAEGVE